MADKVSDRPARIISRTPYSSTGPDNIPSRWVELVQIKYENPAGNTISWESAERKTRPPGVDIDGVGIIAVFEGDGEPELLLQKQFRPPIGKVCIEVPAGLIDAGETPEECALRELREETGYIGKVSKTENGSQRSVVMFNDPGFCNTNLHFIHVTVDMKDPRNRKPIPELEENEFIECFRVKLSDLWETCRKLDKEGYAIDARVGTLAEGFEVAKKWKLKL